MSIRVSTIILVLMSPVTQSRKSCIIRPKWPSRGRVGTLSYSGVELFREHSSPLEERGISILLDFSVYDAIVFI